LNDVQSCLIAFRDNKTHSSIDSSLDSIKYYCRYYYRFYLTPMMHFNFMCGRTPDFFLSYCRYLLSKGIVVLLSRANYYTVGEFRQFRRRVCVTMMSRCEIDCASTAFLLLIYLYWIHTVLYASHYYYNYYYYRYSHSRTRYSTVEEEEIWTAMKSKK
jgi:hypothetical protein